VGRITTKKMQDTEHCPESNKSYKMKQENFYRYAFLSCIEKFRFTGILVYNVLHLPLLTPLGGKTTRGLWLFVHNLIRLTSESLIIHKSYSTSLMIHIVSCVPAFMGFSWKDLPSWKWEILHVMFTTMRKNN
jgi:hypothetical protein